MGSDPKVIFTLGDELTNNEWAKDGPYLGHGWAMSNFCPENKKAKHL